MSNIPAQDVRNSSGLPAWITDHCQFGQHGEPFLWTGSDNDDVNIAIMKLINLAQDNPRLADEACDFILACCADAETVIK